MTFPELYAERVLGDFFFRSLISPPFFTLVEPGSRPPAPSFLTLRSPPLIGRGVYGLLFFVGLPDFFFLETWFLSSFLLGLPTSLSVVPPSLNRGPPLASRAHPHTRPIGLFALVPDSVFCGLLCHIFSFRIGLVLRSSFSPLLKQTPSLFFNPSRRIGQWRETCAIKKIPAFPSVGFLERTLCRARTAGSAVADEVFHYLFERFFPIALRGRAVSVSGAPKIFFERYHVCGGPFFFESDRDHFP